MASGIQFQLLPLFPHHLDRFRGYLVLVVADFVPLVSVVMSDADFQLLCVRRHHRLCLNFPVFICLIMHASYYFDKNDKTSFESLNTCLMSKSKGTSS